MLPPICDLMNDLWQVASWHASLLIGRQVKDFAPQNVWDNLISNTDAKLTSQVLTFVLFKEDILVYIIAFWNMNITYINSRREAKNGHRRALKLIEPYNDVIKYN